MPGKSYSGELPPLTDRQAKLRDALRKDLEHLAGQIGQRNLLRPTKYAEAARWIEQSLAGSGWKVVRQTFAVKGRSCVNLEVARGGDDDPDSILVVGAHYDSAQGTPGANDNGSGVVALLALARALADYQPQRTVRLVFFANEEPPYFQTKSMGSLVYARRCRQRGERIVGMLSLETIGYYSDVEGSQRYPPPFNRLYPSTGNFIGFVGNTDSAALVERCVGLFRDSAKFPSEGGALPGGIEGVGWSDHWSFWQAGYPALMVTDTAPFRYPHYHLRSDTPDKVDCSRMARVVEGLEAVIRALASDGDRTEKSEPEAGSD